MERTETARQSLLMIAEAACESGETRVCVMYGNIRDWFDRSGCYFIRQAGHYAKIAKDSSSWSETGQHCPPQCASQEDY